jgi:hypothetical protein
MNLNNVMIGVIVVKVLNKGCLPYVHQSIRKVKNVVNCVIV